jgi:hypothetical protein
MQCFKKGFFPMHFKKYSLFYIAKISKNCSFLSHSSSQISQNLISTKITLLRRINDLFISKHDNLLLPIETMFSFLLTGSQHLELLNAPSPLNSPTSFGSVAPSRLWSHFLSLGATPLGSQVY